MILNNKGFSLMGLLISSAIGLVITLAIFKGIGNLKKKADVVKDSTVSAFAQQIISSKLRDENIWDKSVEKAGGRIPGSNVGIRLYDADGSGPWVCQRKGGGINRGIVIVSKIGQPQDLDCSRCRKDQNCGFSKKKFSRIELTVTPNDNLRPAYKAKFFDTSGTRKKSSFSIESTSEELYEEKQASCPDRQFLIKVVNGKPVCENDNIAIVNTTWCNPQSYLTGFTSNGTPICTLVLKHGQDIINTNNNSLIKNIRGIDRLIVNLKKHITNSFDSLGRVHKYYIIRGSNDEDCASLKRMTCRDGYMMFAYEALNYAEESRHCSLQCRQISY